ncbi:hypothetical protein OH76DRAFT_1405569 [Lentinus brumalis]|uniref:Autophagy-related protein 29 n=1 Tax=Lentinus brumalis TaxID=2498619 RepID=A0A371D5F8_9APHY|nr:hypothetical protein OH76DRAFT_1405569 [Polyporus brumalis]
MPSPPAVRVIVRLPYNRPEDAPPDPPRVEWNADKEHILWEVIAKSRAIEGANPDWKGLAQHLQVPLPYLLYRAQVRYEEDLRGLQGLGLRTPSSVFPSVPSPQRTGQAEYFPRMSDPARPPLPQRDATPASSSATGGTASTSGTVPGTSTIRPHMGVRARLSSLGSAHGRGLQLRSPIGTDHVQSPLSAHPSGNIYPRPTKKVSSSSTLTLQGPRRTHSPQLRPLSQASSRGAGSSSDGADGEQDTSDEDDESDEDARREEEAEKQELLARKLEDLQRLMTKDALGLVADPVARTNGSGHGNGKPRGRARPVSGMSASLSSSNAPRDYSRSRNQSLSSASVDSPQGSIPSIPSPTPEPNAHAYSSSQTHPHPRSRHHSQGHNATNTYHHPARSQSQSLSSHSLSQSHSKSNSHSNPQSPSRLTSPTSVPRHLTPEKTSSPPALSPGSARGHPANARVQRTHSGLAAGTPTTGSEASSFSDLSDASVSLSALDSALMSNIKGGGSRLSSFARSHLPSKRSTRG